MLLGLFGPAVEFAVEAPVALPSVVISAAAFRLGPADICLAVICVICSRRVLFSVASAII